MRPWEPRGRQPHEHVTDEELQRLARRGLLDNDREATERLLSLVQERRPAELRDLCRSLSRADAEDVFADFFVPVWSAIGQIANGNVDHPWAYLTRTITHSAWRTIRRWITRRNHEELMDPPEMGVTDGCEQPGSSLTGVAVTEWERTLTSPESEAWEVIKRQEVEGISRNEAHRRMNHDRTEQNRIDKRIVRGRHPNGFLDRARRLLVGEEGVL